MSPFSEAVRDEIRRRDRWTCTSCGKSSFDREKWLVEAAHKDHTRNENYDKADNGETNCRICHFLDHVERQDFRGANLLANRIWNTGLRHYSAYEAHPEQLRDDRIQFAEMMSAMKLQGKIHITEKAVLPSEIKAQFRK